MLAQVSTSNTMRIGTSTTLDQPVPGRTRCRPLGALHQAAAGAEAKRLGLRALVGDDRTHDEDRQRQGREPWVVPVQK